MKTGQGYVELHFLYGQKRVDSEWSHWQQCIRDPALQQAPSSALLKSLLLEAPQLWGKNQVFLLLVESCRLPSNPIGSLELRLVCFYLWELRYTWNKPSLQASQKYDSNGSYLGDGNIFVDFFPHQWQFLNFPLEGCVVLNVFIVRRKKPKQTSE